MKYLALSLAGLIGSFGYAQAEAAKSVPVQEWEILGEHFLTADLQKQLTPELVLELLKRGNERYVEDDLLVINTPERVVKASRSQYPAAVVLSCLDSRVPVEDVFHAGIGDLFVARVAGNISNEDILGSMEYGCKVAGAKLIVVLGHEYCGAVESAIKDVKLGNITGLLAKIRPAVEEVEFVGEGERNEYNRAFINAVTKQNVLDTMNSIRENSPILKGLEDQGQIVIVGGVYDMDTGRVTFFDPAS